MGGRSPSGRQWVVLLLSLGAFPLLGAVPSRTLRRRAYRLPPRTGRRCAPLSEGTWDAGTDTCSFSSGLTINSTTTLDIGADVTVDGYAIVNAGTINNDGTITASGGEGGSYHGSCLTGGGGGGTGGDAITNSGTINNQGTITVSGGIGGASGDDGGLGGTGGSGIVNSRTINNDGTVTARGGSGGTGEYGGGNGGDAIANSDTINNDGSITGNGGSGGTSVPSTDGTGGSGVVNSATLNDYCGATLSYSSYQGNSPNPISCYTVTFDQSGISTSWVIWAVTVAWGPFVLPMDHTGTGAGISVQAVGSLNYSFDSPVKFTGTTYDCSAGCSGTSSVSGALTFSATYIISGSCVPVTTDTAVSCSPWEVPVNYSSTCVATVTGSSPTGTVVFTTSVGATSQFQLPTCALSSGTCHVAYTPTALASPVTITATYEGDSNNGGSSGTFSLTVITLSITTSYGSTVCPILGGTWDAGTDTCSISSGGFQGLPGLTISSTATLNIGVGVTVAVSGQTGTSCYDGWNGANGGDGIYNAGTINNDGTITASGGEGGAGCYKEAEGPGHPGHAGTGGTGGDGIYNAGTINNNGTITASGAQGGDSAYGAAPAGYGAVNAGTINDYCGATLTYTSYEGTTASAASCYTVTFDQSGIPSGATWGVTVSWPFGTTDHTGTGGASPWPISEGRLPIPSTPL